MSKSLIVVLSIVMGVALVGLILVQTYWIKSAYVAKENQFSQVVNWTLEDAAYKIEQTEAMGFVLDELNKANFSDSTVYVSNDSNFDTVVYIQNDDDSAYLYTQNISYKKDIDGGELEANFSINEVYPRNEVTDSLLKRLEEEGLVNSANRLNIRASIQQSLIDRQQMVDKVVSNLFTSEKNIKDRIKPKDVDLFTREMLINNGIILNFEYAVVEQNANVVFSSQKFKPGETDRIYQTQLFPGDFFSAPSALVLYFPNKRNFIFRSLGTLGVSSVILTLLIVLTFAFTLFIIFRQKQLSEVKSDFVNNMTHELKTPISTISLASQMLGDKSIPAESKNLDRISNIIADESKRLGYQVEKVLQMAVFEQGKILLKLSQIDFHELVNSVVSNFIILVEKKGGMLIPSLHADKTWVKIDTVHMTNVLSNLLDNAVKYSDKTPEIYIETFNKGGKLFVSVRDNGIGINKANQRRVFDKFFRVSTGNVHNVKGFGLGLSYVRKIIEEHKGQIKVDSEPGVGTVFTIILPLVGDDV